MNHRKIYFNLIEKSVLSNRHKLKKSHPDYVYYEKHHIIPKCLGGSNDLENLVLLTPKEHYFCHKLLTYIYPKNRKIGYAFHLMTYINEFKKISARDYEHAKLMLSGSNNTMFGKSHSKNTIQKLKIPKSNETKLNMSAARKGKSYEEFYGVNASNMKQQRQIQTSGKGNPNSHKYVILNSKLDKSWICHGNLSKFGKEYHVSGRTFILSRQRKDYVNCWKCEEFDLTNSIHANAFIYN